MLVHFDTYYNSAEVPSDRLTRVGVVVKEAVPTSSLSANLSADTKNLLHTVDSLCNCVASWSVGRLLKFDDDRIIYYPED